LFYFIAAYILLQMFARVQEITLHLHIFVRATVACKIVLEFILFYFYFIAEGRKCALNAAMKRCDLLQCLFHAKVWFYVLENKMNSAIK